MNFGRKHTIRKKQILSESKDFGKKAGIGAIRALFITFIAIGLIGFSAIFGVVRGIIDDAPAISDVNIVPSGYATYIYDVDGNQLQKLTAPSSNRISVSIADIPQDMQNAVIAVEDERFYSHNGIDPLGIIRAFVVGVQNGLHFSEGASTITQQLLKNNVFTTWTQESTMTEKVRRKFQEQYLAVALERELTSQGSDAKEIILENYLNTINLGAGAYGVQAAAQRYFNKNVQDLTLSECTVIAGISKNPTAYNPITHPDRNRERRNKVLSNMLKQNYITQEQYDECQADNVYERVAAASAITSEEKIYSYFIDELTAQIVHDLQSEKGYTKEQAYQALYSGGLQIYTTQDPNIQAIADEEYTNPDNFPENIEYSIDWALTITKASGEQVNYSKEMLRSHFQQSDENFDLLFSSQEEAQSYIDAYKASLLGEGDSILAERVSFLPEPQSSLVIMDQATGYVKAIIGGRGEKTASLTLNRATDTNRQPGSAFKILAAYGPAINEGLVNLATVIKDEPYNYENGRAVKNASGDFMGDITVRTAINHSVNVAAVKTITDLTPKKAFDYLKSMGFTSLVDQKAVKNKLTGQTQVFSDINQPLALGGLTYGINNLELTGAYAMIANGGKYIKPIFYTKILDKDGNVLIDNTSTPVTVFKDSTAYLLTSAMETVVSEGTGRDLALNNMPVAGKTGTTTSYNDLWFAGFTPYYTCTVWAGYDNNEKLPDAGVYRSYHKNLWRKIMGRIHENLPYTDFQIPASVEKATICQETGLLANSACPSITEYFPRNTVPTDRCKQHYYVPVQPEVSTPETPAPTTPTNPGDTTNSATENNSPPTNQETANTEPSQDGEEILEDGEDSTEE